MLINAEDGFLSVADDAVTIIAAGASLLGESCTDTDEGAFRPEAPLGCSHFFSNIF